MFQKVHALADAWCQSSVRESLSKRHGVATSQGDVQEVLLSIKGFKGDVRYSCVPITTTQDIDALCMWLQTVAEGKATEGRLCCQAANSFMQSCIDILSTWLKYTPPALEDGIVEDMGVLCGADAAAKLFLNVEQMPMANVSQSLIVQLRNYDWLLAVSQRDYVSKLIAEVISSTKRRMLMPMLQDGENCGKKKPGNAQSSASGSADQVSASAFQSFGDDTPAKKLKAASKQSTRERMLALCGGGGAKAF